MKYHSFDNFGKTVNLNFIGLTGVNSSCSISSQKSPKKGQIFPVQCPSELTVVSLRMFDQFHNLLGTALRMSTTFHQVLGL